MSYSNRGKNAHVRDGRILHVALKCCWKRNVLLSIHANDTPPNSLKDSNVNPKMETTEKKGVWVCSLVRSILGVKGACQNFGMGIKTSDRWVNYSYGHAPTKKQVG
jgi:hypothetical protein